MFWNYFVYKPFNNRLVWTSLAIVWDYYQDSQGKAILESDPECFWHIMETMTREKAIERSIKTMEEKIKILESRLEDMSNIKQQGKKVTYKRYL